MISLLLLTHALISNKCTYGRHFKKYYMQWAGLDVLAQITFHIGACTLYIHINIHICTYMYIYILKRFVGATQLISHPVTPDTYMVHAGQSCWGRGRRPSGHPHLRSVAGGQVVPRWSQILALPLGKGMMVWGCDDVRGEGVSYWGEPERAPH